MEDWKEKAKKERKRKEERKGIKMKGGRRKIREGNRKE